MPGQLTDWECVQGAIALTAISLEGPDSTAGKIDVSPDGKLDDDAKAENWLVAEVFKVYLFFLLDLQKPGGLLESHETAPSAGTLLAGFKPVLDKLLPLLPGKAGVISAALLNLLSGLGGGGTAAPPATTTPVPALPGNP